MPAPVASGGSGSPGGACTRWKRAALSRRTWIPDLTYVRRRPVTAPVPGRSAARARALPSRRKSPRLGRRSVSKAPHRTDRPMNVISSRALGSPQREAILCAVRQWPISVANESFFDAVPPSPVRNVAAAHRKSATGSSGTPPVIGRGRVKFYGYRCALRRTGMSEAYLTY